MTSVENRARLVLGNWKMNGNLAENAALLTELRAWMPAIARSAFACRSRTWPRPLPP